MRNNPRLSETVAANVRAELGRNRISQVKAATAIQMSAPALSKRLNCQLPFTIDEIDALGVLLGVNPAALLAEPARLASA